MREYTGIRPLYNPLTPSVFSVFEKQSMIPLYMRPLPDASLSVKLDNKIRDRQEVTKYIENSLTNLLWL